MAVCESARLNRKLYLPLQQDRFPLDLMIEQGRFDASQIFFKGSRTEGLLYFEGLPLRLGLGLVKRLK
jgi:hypothetical protein